MNNDKKYDLMDEHGEVRELTSKDMTRFKATEDVLPSSLVALLPKRGKQKMPIKKAVSIRLSQDVVDTFKATGKGWQSRIDNVLKEYIATHPD